MVYQELVELRGDKPIVFHRNHTDENEASP